MPTIKKYSNPFLSQVIARVDFVSPFKEIASKLPAGIQKQVISGFPMLEAVDKIRKNDEGPEWVQRAEWSFFNPTRTKRVAITAYEFFLDCSKYEGFENLKADLLPIVDQFLALDNNLVARRFGLRYINKFSFVDANRQDFVKYFRDDLLVGFDVLPDSQQALSRAFHNIVCNYRDVALHMNYGIHNPDFPAPILNNEFIIDMDAHSQFAIELTGIATLLDSFHKRIQDLFEAVIKDDLRQLMGAEYE